MAKNSKKQKVSDTNTSGGKTGFRIPKKNSLLEIDPSQEERGSTTINFKCADKFSNDESGHIRKAIKSNLLLPKEMSSLCYSFENLLINSISKQMWAKHSSAWNLYKEFCFCFNTKFELPISVQYVRAFSTWAVTLLVSNIRVRLIDYQ